MLMRWDGPKFVETLDPREVVKRKKDKDHYIHSVRYFV